MTRLICFLLGLLCSFSLYAQIDELPAIGVSTFTSESGSKFSGAVTQEVIEILTQTQRFRVLDRTNYDKVKQELEFQKTEAFLDTQKLADQNGAIAAEYLVTGNIIKMNVYAMKNTDGSVKGYKSSISFQMKVTDVSKGSSSNAESFQTEVSPLMLSAESAVNEAIKSVDESLRAWVLNNFPLKVKVLKVLSLKKNAAETILVSGGKGYGLKVGDKLIVEKTELLDGLPYPTTIAEVKITKLAGDNFAEADVQKGGEIMLSTFNAAGKLSCTLIK